MKSILELRLVNIAKIKRYVQLCTKFSGRTIRNIKKLQELIL